MFSPTTASLACEKREKRNAKNCQKKKEKWRARGREKRANGRKGKRGERKEEERVPIERERKKGEQIIFFTHPIARVFSLFEFKVSPSLPALYFIPLSF